MFGSEPDKNQVERARRALERLVPHKLSVAVDGGPSQTKIYRKVGTK
jgi:hypothetical protein